MWFLLNSRSESTLVFHLIVLFVYSLLYYSTVRPPQCTLTFYHMWHYKLIKKIWIFLFNVLFFHAYPYFNTWLLPGSIVFCFYIITMSFLMRETSRNWFQKESLLLFHLYLLYPSRRKIYSKAIPYECSPNDLTLGLLQISGGLMGYYLLGVILADWYQSN